MIWWQFHLIDLIKRIHTKFNFHFYKFYMIYYEI
jgi:hypothetical protein